MMYLFNYRDVKIIQQERVKRSLGRFANSGTSQPDSYRRPTRDGDAAEVVELVFATACDTDRIGA